MKSNGIVPSLSIRPVVPAPYCPPSMNSPKHMQPIKLLRQPHSFIQPHCLANHDNSEHQTIPLYKSNKNRTTSQYQTSTTVNAQNINRLFDGNNNGYKSQELLKINSVTPYYSIQNFTPNLFQYNQMNQKLNILQSKLDKIKNKFYSNQQIRKFKIFKSDQPPYQSNIINQKNNSQVLKQIVNQVTCPKNIKTINFNPYSTKDNIYYISQLVKAYNQPNSLVRQHMITSFHQLKALKRVRGHTKEQLAAKKLKLTQKNCYIGKKTVVFDLDQTLIHCNQSSNLPCDTKLPIKLITGQVVQAGINIRPYTTQILKKLSQHFQIITFTASHSCYANVVLDYLDPQNKYISHRLFRQHCFQTLQGVYIKDLRIINRELTDLVLIDNAAYSYSLQIDNGIPIIPFYRGKVDYELKALQTYLQRLIQIRDVRECNRNTFKLGRYTQFQNPDTLFKTLYIDFFQ